MKKFDILFKEGMGTAMDEDIFDEYFVYEGQQQIDLEGKKTIPLFTLRKDWEGLTKLSTYTPKTLEQHGVEVPEKYFQKNG